jgi:hypothetical protein
MGKMNLIIVVLMALVIGSNLSNLHSNLTKIDDSLDHSLLNMQTELLGSYALSYGMQKLQSGEVVMQGVAQTWNTPQFAVSIGEIDSICYIPVAGDTVEVIPYIKNWQSGQSVASNSRALIDFFIAQPEDQFAYFTMDEGSGTTLTDLSPLGNDGTLTNMDDSNWVEGVDGEGAALTFDGEEDYVELGSDITGDYDGMLTVAVWVEFIQTGPVDFGNIITENSDDLGNQITGYTLRSKSKFVGHPYLELEFIVVTLNGQENVYLRIEEDEMDLLGWHYIVGVLNMDAQQIMIGVVDENIWAIDDIHATGMPPKSDDSVLTIGHIVGAPNGNGRKSGLTGNLDSMRTIADVMTIDQLLQLMVYDGVKMPKLLEWSL